MTEEEEEEEEQKAPGPCVLALLSSVSVSVPDQSLEPPEWTYFRNRTPTNSPEQVKQRRSVRLLSGVN